MIYHTYRVCGIDVTNVSHTNKIGKGKPYNQQTITGTHRHIWTAQGYGYDEPLLEGIDYNVKKFHSVLKKTPHSMAAINKNCEIFDECELNQLSFLLWDIAFLANRISIEGMSWGRLNLRPKFSEYVRDLITVHRKQIQ